jgi:hypothetical protein
MKIYFNEKTSKVIKIQKVVRGWLARRKFEKDLKDLLAYTGDEDLLLTSEEIRRRDCGRKVFACLFKNWMRKRLERKRLAAAIKI